MSNWLVAEHSAFQTAQPAMRCPHCDADTGVLALLTAMNAYFVCSSCDHRWDDRLTRRRP